MENYKRGIKMKRKVIKIINDCVLELDDYWSFCGEKGKRIKIAGLKPALKSQLYNEKKEMTRLLKGKEIVILTILNASKQCASTPSH